MSEGRQLGSAPIDFGKDYDAQKMRRLADHMNKLTSLVQRMAQLLDQGESGQILTKTEREDFLGEWRDNAAALSLSLDSGKLLGRWSPGSGPPEEIEIGDNLLLTGNVLSAESSGSSSGGYPIELGYSGI